MRPANERRRYNVTSSLIGRAHSQNDPCLTGPHAIILLAQSQPGTANTVQFNKCCTGVAL